MSYVRVESSVRTNKKFLIAGPAPSWLWLCGLAYCQEGLTDGYIPVEAIDYLGVKNARRLAKHLVEAGLWDICDGGWYIHDYLEHNKSAAEVHGIKVERRQAGSRGGLASGIERRRSKQVASAPIEATLTITSKQPSNPSTATPTATSTATATETPRARFTAPIVDQREHRKHALCGRVCLHASLFGEFVRRRNHDNADTEVRQWAGVVLSEWADRPDEPGDAFDFWRARYEEQWPPTKATKSKWADFGKEAV